MDPKLHPDDLAAVMAAKDVPELVATTRLVDPGVWALLRPTAVGSQVLLANGDPIGIDPLPGSQIASLPFPVGGAAALASASWASRLLALLSFQNDLTGHTDLIQPVWEEGSLIAVAGGGNHMLLPFAMGIRRLHQISQAQRDVEGARYLLTRADKAVILAAPNGKLILGTAMGLEALQEFLPIGCLTLLPPRLRAAINQEIRQLKMDDYQVNLSRLPLPEPTTVSPLVSVRFSRKKQRAQRHVDLATALRELTPAEEKIYHYLVAGLRTKEIADKVSSSFHTTRHHISSILQKCGCDDRLLLLAKVKKLGDTPTSKNPTVPPLQAVDVPLPAPRQKRIPA